jgi:magnesium transporter
MDSTFSTLSRDAIRQVVEQGDAEAIRVLLSSMHAEDVADLVESLSPEEGSLVLSALEGRDAGDALAELSDQAMEDVLEEMSTETISEAVETMAADDAADVIGALSDELRGVVLDDLDEPDKEAVSKLLSYGEDTAGGIMTPEVVSVPVDATAGDAIRQLRGLQTPHDDVFVVYVVDGEERLQGRLPLHRLVTAAKHAPVSALLQAPLVSCTVDLDQEEVAQMMARYNLVALPVVDAHGRLVGRVTFDDVIDVISDEATEDILRMAGSSAREVAERSALRIAGVRLPWVIVGLAGGLTSGYFMSMFSDILKLALGLAFFVPAVAALGGNIGIQSSTIVIRAMTTGDFSYSGVWKPVLRELRVGLTIGLICGLLAAVVASLWFRDPGMGLVVGLAMLGIGCSAALVGSSLPLILDRFGIDPAVATGPFITTANDVLGILLYFSLATILFRFVNH